MDILDTGRSMISGGGESSSLSSIIADFLSGLLPLVLSFSLPFPFTARPRPTAGELPATDEGVRRVVAEAGEEVAVGALVFDPPPTLPEEPVREGAGPGFLVKNPLRVDCFLLDQYKVK